VGDGVAVGVYYNDASPAGADYTVQADVIVVNNASAAYPGVVGRMATGADTYYRLFYDQPGGQWVLDKQVAGANTSLDTAAQSLSNSTTYEIRLEMIGTAIKGYVDDVEVLSATDSSIAAAGKAGLLLGASSIMDLDNFIATDSGGAPAATRSLGLLGVGQ
jgi:hypothetical protein